MFTPCTAIVGPNASFWYLYSPRIWIAALFFIFSSTQVLAGGPVSREEASRLTENLMIEGKYGMYQSVAGKEELQLNLWHWNNELFNSSRLRHNVPDTSYVISLIDNRGKALFGLLKGGGWSFSGGLIDLVPRDATSLDLFGFEVIKWRSNLFGGFFFSSDVVYDFYLLARDVRTRKGKIIKKWTFENEGEQEDIAGFLKYSTDTDEVEVMIKGLKEDFKEIVKVE